jgi:hypothetical protein
MPTSKNEPDWNTPTGTIIDSYDATPPSINLKCIVFSVIIVLLYLILPRNNKAFVGLFIGSILGVVFYDKRYSCNEGTNVRSIIAAILMVLFFKFAPSGNKLVLLACLYFPYLIMAIYDYHFNCKRNKFGPTFLALFYSWAKPAYSTQIETYKNWHPHWKNMISKFDSAVLVIILIILPFYFNKKFKLPQPIHS